MNEDQTLQHELNTYSTVNEEIARDTRARQLQSSRLRVALFKGLQSECAEERREALEKIIEVAKSYLRLARSPFSVTSPETPATPPTSSNASKRPSLPSPSILSPNQQKAPIAHQGATGNMYDAETYDNDEEHQEEDDWTDEQLQYFLLTMLRLSHSCPFNDVRQTFKDFLQMLAATQTKLSPTPSHFSPSIFISLADIFSLESNSSYKSIQSCPRPSNISFSLWSQESDPDNEEKSDVMEQATATGGRQSDEYVRQMMVRTFLDEGRLANLFRVMAFFPTFYEIYRTTYLNITKASIGPLGRSWKCYLGILACAEQKCQYLVSMLKLEFLQSGGDPTWLKSIEYCPPKLQRISRVVLKLARQPWRLTTEDVRSLMSAFGASLGEFWSKGELVQAVVIIATFLGLSSFTLACGIAPEMDMRGGFSVLGSHEGELEGVEHELDLRTPLSPGRNMEIARAAASAATGWHDSDILFEEGRQEFSSDIGRGLGVSVDEDDNDEPEQNEDVIEHTSELIWKLKSTKDSAIKEELLESFEKVNLHKQDDTESDNGKQKLTIDTMTMQEGQKEQTWSSNPSFEDFTRFMHAEEDQQILLENFEAGHNGCEEFMLSEYCWEDHGCDLVNQFLPGLGEELDEEFNEALSITDWSIFHQVADGAVDTSPLRNAIWYYTQQLLGIVKEDYDYEDIGKFLNARNKEYIKKVCQQPSQVRRNDWNNIGLSLRPEEKCHMNLLIASAKKQALLCYGLSIVSQM